MYRTVIFDLDGTLLDTIGDLAAAANAVCRENGWPEYTVQAVEGMVGHGIPNLVSRFSPAEAQEPQTLERTLAQFNRVYGAHNMELTAPYAGMPEAVERLRAAGVRTAVLSNKAHALAGPVVEDYYPGQFPWVQGALPGLPTKPDPTLLHRLMEQMGASPEDTLFVGDSDVDIRTARNGGLTSCGVLWGFRGRAELETEGADCLARTPEELVKAVLGDG